MGESGLFFFMFIRAHTTAGCALEVDTPILGACECSPRRDPGARDAARPAAASAVRRLVALTGAACLVVCAAFVMPPRSSMQPVQVRRVEVYGGEEEDGATGPIHLAAVQTERYRGILLIGL